MNDRVQAPSRPWEMPIWKPVRGKEGVLIYIVSIHVLAVIGLILYPIPSFAVFVTALVFNLLGSLGTTVCNHRALSHRTLKLDKVVEHFLVFWTVFNGSGAPAHWVANHRLHHSKADTEHDVSSPTHGGFWWAHLRWLYQTEPAQVERWAPDLNKPEYNFWGRLETWIVLFSVLCGLAFGWEAFFWVGAIRLVYSLHLQCVVNSLMHMGDLDENGESSKNLWWLGPLQLSAWGENWHQNHHQQANSARLGLKWWQVDIGWYFIWTLEKIGLAHGVKRPRTI